MKKLSRGINLKAVALDNLCFIVGCILYALGVNLFAIPNNIAQSGITGVAIIINYLFPAFPVGLTAFVLNIPLIILAWFIIGRAFTLKTLWATALISITIDVVTKLIERGVVGVYTGDKLLASLFAV